MRSSVINLIYSGQQQFSYTTLLTKAQTQMLLSRESFVRLVQYLSSRPEPYTRHSKTGLSQTNVGPGKPYWMDRIITVVLLVLTSLDQLLFILKLYFSVFTNNLPYWGGQPYWAFPFSKSSLVGPSLSPTLKKLFQKIKVNN